MPTGIPGLDVVTQGGLPAGRLHLVAGEPGAGKTILAHQIGSAVVRTGGTVLYLTMHTEAHHSLLAQARTLTFFDPADVARERFRYVSLSATLDEEGATGLRTHIGRLVQTYAPALLVLDGLHMLKLLGGDDSGYHRFLLFLQAQATLTGITTLALTNYDGAAPADPMYAVPDGILHVRTERHGQRDVRRLAVSKLRGSAALTGWHDYRLGAGGLRIFPRLEAHVAAIGLPAQQPSRGRAGFGISGLDALVGGGVPDASVTLVAGAPGAGKTLIGLSFLAAGAAAGERGLYLGFREARDRLVAKAEGVGLSLGPHLDAGTLTIDWLAPLELLVDELAEYLLARGLGAAWRRMAGTEPAPAASLAGAMVPVAPPIGDPSTQVSLPNARHATSSQEGAELGVSGDGSAGHRGPGGSGSDDDRGPNPTLEGAAPGPVRRIFLDGLDDLRRACLDADRLPAFLAALTDLFRAHGVSVLMSQEIAQPFGADVVLPVDEMSAAVDNLLLLRHIETDGRLERRVSVLKVREQASGSGIQPFSISAAGIRVGEERAVVPAGASDHAPAARGTVGDATERSVGTAEAWDAPRDPRRR